MPTRKTVEKTGTETAEAAAGAAKTRARSTASKPRTPAATHKRASRKTAAEMRVPTHEEIAALAYSYWEARGFKGGSDVEDWLRAERELTGR